MWGSLRTARGPQPLEWMNMPRAQRSPLRVRITEQQEAELRRIAEEDGSTMAELVRRLIADFIRKRPAPK